MRRKYEENNGKKELTVFDICGIIKRSRQCIPTSKLNEMIMIKNPTWRLPFVRFFFFLNRILGHYSKGFV